MKKDSLKINSVGWKFNYPTNKLCSCKDTADYFQLPLYVVYSLRKTGAIPSVEIQGMYFFEKQNLIKWIKENQPERLFNQNQQKSNLFKVVQYYLNILTMFFK